MKKQQSYYKNTKDWYRIRQFNHIKSSVGPATMVDPSIQQINWQCMQKQRECTKQQEQANIEVVSQQVETDIKQLISATDFYIALYTPQTYKTSWETKQDLNSKQESVKHTTVTSTVTNTTKNIIRVNGKIAAYVASLGNNQTRKNLPNGSEANCNFIKALEDQVVSLAGDVQSDNGRGTTSHVSMVIPALNFALLQNTD